MRDPGRLGRLRVAGLVATVLLTVAAFGAGALPSAGRLPDAIAPSSMEHWTGRASGYWFGLAAWLAGLTLLSVTWWRLGGRLERYPGVVSPRWLLVTAALWAAPLLVAPPLGSRDVYSYACQGALWLDGVDPYRVGAAPGGCVWSPAVASDWHDTPAPYGPLAIALAGGAVATARAVGGPDEIQLVVVVGLLRAVALAGALLVAGFLPRLARRSGVDPAAATWLVLLSPLVAVHLVSGAHNDALLVGLVVAALAVAATGPDPERARPARVPPALAAGVALGAATAIKVTAVLAVPFAVLLVAMGTTPETTMRTATAPADGPNPHRPVATRVPTPRGLAGTALWRLAGTALWRLAGTALWVAGVAAAVFAALTLVTGLDLGWIEALGDTGRLVQWTSLPTGLGMATGYLLWLAGAPDAFAPAVTVARAIGTALLVVGTIALGAVVTRRVLRGTATRCGVVTACGLAFAGFALLAPVFYPWYALAPLAVLAAGVTDRRWRRRIAAASLGVVFLVLPDGLGLAVLTKLPGAIFVLLLVIALAVVTTRRRAPRRPAEATRCRPG